MAYKTDNVVIVGGGSAGWMAASTFIKAFPNKNITLIESSSIPKVGVGESTVQDITSWLNYLDIDYKEFMAYTNASYKLAIGFTNFKTQISSTFYYPFGSPDLTDTLFGINDWHFRKTLNPNIPDSDYVKYYYPQAHCFDTNKIFMDEEKLFYPYYRTDKDIVYQFDASLFGDWLANKYAIPKGVKRIIGTVGRINGNEDGIISIVLEDGTEVFGDLFIDCTGFRSLLLGQYLNEPFISLRDVLPNNKAWATQVPYNDKEKELKTYTNCTGEKNGWVWNIPLWNRMGSGYVFSDEFVDDDTALQEYKNHLDSHNMVFYDPNRSKSLDFKKIEIRNGYHERFWVKNVCAIGLSNGFVEPLESTGLMMIHQFVRDLVSTIQNRDHVTRWDIDSFNKNNVETIRGISKFVAMHFQFSQRDDTPYWKKLTMEKEYPNDYFDLSKQVYNNREFYSPIWSCIAVGLGYTTITPIILQELNFSKNLNLIDHLNAGFIARDQKRKLWKESIDTAPTHYEYLKKNIYNEID